ncbi:MAG: class I SAM-dependent methyltransferase [Alphaproteobacteria bacterium]
MIPSFVTSPVKRIARLLARRYVQSILEDEWNRAQCGDLFGEPNERPVEYAFALAQIARHCPHSVLDIGTGMTAWPHLLANCGLQVTATDNIRDYWTKTIWNRHWLVENDNIVNTSMTKTFDMITCMSVLEHIVKYEDAARSIARLLKPGGRAIVSVPFNNDLYIDNVYKMEGSRLNHPGVPFVGHVFSRAALEGAFAKAGMDLEDEDLFDAHTGDYWSIGKRKSPIVRASRDSKHDLGCFAFRKAHAP